MSIYKTLSKIQAELKAAKSQYNSFGKYNYRSCEDIIEAVKPLLYENDLVLLMSDEIVNIGNHNYIRTLARISDGENHIEVSATAREAENRKGMDDSQITGATSSYARKYALNGLFAIDDTKDADTMKPREEEKKEAKDKIPQRNWIAEIKTVSTIDELKSLYKEACDNTEGKERAEVTREKDKRKTEITELGGNSQAQRGE
jgi:hypothetical protein